MTDLISSSVVAGFNSVAIARGLRFPCCGEPIAPQCFEVHDGTVAVICPHCHIVAMRLDLTAIPVIKEIGDED